MEAMRERMKELLMDTHTFVEMHLGHQLAQVCMHVYIHTQIQQYECMHTRTCICVFVCVFIYIYIYIYIYTHTLMDRHTFVEMHLGHQLAQVCMHVYIYTQK